eukprot:356433-Prorocentrum_minimum.AAC.1
MGHRTVSLIGGTQPPTIVYMCDDKYTRRARWTPTPAGIYRRAAACGGRAPRRQSPPPRPRLRAPDPPCPPPPAPATASSPAPSASAPSAAAAPPSSPPSAPSACDGNNK